MRSLYLCSLLLAGALMSLNAQGQLCGNALLDAGEACDDGNGAGGDGCSPTCQVEPGYECTLPEPPVLLNGVASGGFEGGLATGDWSQTNFLRSQFCSTGSGGCAQGSGARSGNWWARFGGTSATGETASLEQDLVIETTDGSLTFWLEIPECDSAADFLGLSLDGVEVFRADGAHAACGQAGYVQQSIDLATAPGGPYNDGLVHTLRFDVQTFVASGGPSTFLVDEVLIDRGLSDPVPSTCTAYESCFLETFDPGTGALPNTWTVFEDVPTGPARNWGTTDDGDCGTGPATDGQPGNFTGGSGEAACADSDATGGTWSAYLCSEAIDLTNASGSRLKFLYNYQFATDTPGPEDRFRVLVGAAAPSVDSVPSYSVILDTSTEEQGSPFSAPGASEEIDLVAFQGAAVYLCFHYGGDDDEYAQVDDVELRADSCAGGPPPEPPAAPPGGINATDAVYTDRVRVTWNDVPDETSYEVFRCSTTDSSSCGAAITTTAGNITLHDDAGAAADGTMHHYRLKACNSAGCSAFSAADAGNRRYVPPPPGNVSASDGTFNDRVRVTWNDVAGEDYFELYRCSTTSANSCGSAIASPATDTTSYDDSGANPDGRTHYYRLKACKSATACSELSTADAGFRAEVCGDAILGISESCDDGNATGGDGCSAACQVEAGYECTLPTGQSPSACTTYASCFLEDFDPAIGDIPGSWTRFETTSQGNNWTTTDSPACALDNLTGGSGESACLDQETVGLLVDAYLCSDSIDLTAASNVRLRFLLNYQVFSRSADDVFDVLAGTGAPNATSLLGYSTIYTANGLSAGSYFSAPGQVISADLGLFEGSSVHLCFRYRADDDWYAQVDDVEVRAFTCEGGPPPDVPGGLSASDGTHTDKVFVSWNDVAGEDRFEVYRCSTANSGTCGTAIATTAINMTSYEDTGADPDGTVHYYRVKACSDVSGCSGFSVADAGNRASTGDACTLTISQPGGGESWVAGSTYFVNWSKSGAACAATADLALHQAGSFVQTIASATSDTTYAWSIPPGQAIGYDYTVRVADSTNPDYSAESASPFVINDPYCNTHIAPAVTEFGSISHEACDLLIIPPGLVGASGSALRFSSGRNVVLEPGVTVETGGTFTTTVCGQSLCETQAGPMPAGCHSCVDLVCDSDPSCCSVAWDQACVDRVNSDCALVCE